MAFPCRHCQTLDPCACPTNMPPGLWVDMRRLQSFYANGRLCIADMLVMNGVEFRRLTQELYEAIKNRVGESWPKMSNPQRASLKAKVKPIREWAVACGW